MSYLLGIVRCILYLLKRFFNHECLGRAAALAYATLLSLVPLTLVSFSVLSVFPVFEGVGQALQHFILSNFVADSANVIARHLNVFLQHVQILSIGNVIFLIVIAVFMIVNMVGAFNDIWQVKLQRHFALSFFIYLIALLVMPIVFGLLMIISSYLASLPLLMRFNITEYVKKPVLLSLPYLVSFLAFTFFNWFLPSTKVLFRYAALAGLLTTFFFELAKHSFSLYLYYFPTYRIIYGALAVIPIFLIWMYVSWAIILFGAIFCHFLSTKQYQQFLGRP